MEEEEIFSGWENPDEIDFFGEESPTKNKKEPKTKEKDDDDDDIKPIVDKNLKEDEEELEEEEQIDFFTDEEEEDEDEEDEDTKSKSKEKAPKVKSEKISSKTSLEFLKEKGLVEYELEEGEELTDEKAEEILEDSFEDGIERRVTEIMEDLPDVVKQQIKFAMNGGNVNTILSNLSKASTGITKDTDISKEDNQIKVIRQELSLRGDDEDTIEAQIEFFKDSGKLEKTAKSFFEKAVKREDEQLKAQLKQQEDNRIAQKENRRKFKNDLIETLQSEKELEGMKFNRKDKLDLPSYISDATIKLENGNSISGLQKDIMETLKDKKKTLMLAKILKNDFDFSDFTKEATTKVTRGVKKELENTETNTPKRSKGGAFSKKSLEDYFK